jgi:sigma-B regulation protein RsbU (phosphoserine phosphatase)
MTFRTGTRKFDHFFSKSRGPRGGVNAGHNAPMLFRREGSSWHITRLDIGGVVVGLFPDFQYQQATLTLAPGDRLVAFTDGISEAMNLAEEEWGEERLIEAAQSCDGSVAAETITRVMRVVDAFTAGAPQHDDMTLVVVRMTNDE